jgi:hypothetical protein
VNSASAAPWRPLLEGELAERARSWTSDIAAHLAAHANAPEVKSPSLASGQSGLACFHAYLSRDFPDSEHAARAEQCLERAVDGVATRRVSASLHGGFPGVAWANEHLTGATMDPAEEDPNDDIDSMVTEVLDAPPGWNGPYDLVDGLVGMGVYALERVHRPSAARCLERIVEELENSARPIPEGFTWWTAPKWLSAEARAQYPRGYYGLGLAHGVPGIIAMLAGTVAANIASQRATPLLEGAVSWVLAQRMDSPRSAFPHRVGPGIQPEPGRASWCEGDPGVAMALLLAARATRRQDWEQAALEVARGAAKRDPANSGVRDASLCHGAAGLGHLFNRLFQMTGEQAFAEAGRFWFGQALGLRQPKQGVGGYQYLSFNPSTHAYAFVDRMGVLEGAAGVALALMAATTSIEPAWDRMFLLSVAPLSAPTPALL